MKRFFSVRCFSMKGWRRGSEDDMDGKLSFMGIVLVCLDR
jgi:hypothetical protein